MQVLTFSDISDAQTLENSSN